MPRLDHRFSTDTAFPYEVQVLLALFVGQLNILREQLTLAPLTAAQVRQWVRQYIAAHPRP